MLQAIQFIPHWACLQMCLKKHIANKIVGGKVIISKSKTIKVHATVHQFLINAGNPDNLLNLLPRYREFCVDPTSYIHEYKV